MDLTALLEFLELSIPNKMNTLFSRCGRGGTSRMNIELRDNDHDRAKSMMEVPYKELLVTTSNIYQNSLNYFYHLGHKELN